MFRTTLNRTVTGNDLLQRAIGAAALALVFVAPVAIWVAGLDVEYYRLYPALPGQYLYLASKLFGLCAIWMFAAQVATGLLRYIPRWQALVLAWPHRMFGPLAVGLMVLHFTCFALGVAVRKEESSLQLFVPNFSDFYHGAISIGVFAAAGAMVAAFGRCWARFKKPLHNLMLPMTMLALIHSYVIGTETRAGWFHIAHLGLFALLVAASYSAWRHGWRPWR